VREGDGHSISIRSYGRIMVGRCRSLQTILVHDKWYRVFMAYCRRGESKGVGTHTHTHTHTHKHWIGPRGHHRQYTHISTVHYFNSYLTKIVHFVVYIIKITFWPPSRGRCATYSACLTVNVSGYHRLACARPITFF